MAQTGIRGHLVFVKLTVALQFGLRNLPKQTERAMLKRLLILAALLSWSAFASAATSTGTFNVGITLNSNCVVNTSATSVAFTYTSFGAAATSNSSFTL